MPVRTWTASPRGLAAAGRPLHAALAAAALVCLCARGAPVDHRAHAAAAARPQTLDVLARAAEHWGGVAVRRTGARAGGCAGLPRVPFVLSLRGGWRNEKPRARRAGGRERGGRSADLGGSRSLLEHGGIEGGSGGLADEMGEIDLGSRAAGARSGGADEGEQHSSAPQRPSAGPRRRTGGGGGQTGPGKKRRLEEGSRGGQTERRARHARDRRGGERGGEGGDRGMQARRLEMRALQAEAKAGNGTAQLSLGLRLVAAARAYLASRAPRTGALPPALCADGGGGEGKGSLLGLRGVKEGVQWVETAAGNGSVAAEVCVA